MDTRLKQITRVLNQEQILAAYDRVAELYPHVPSLSMWRAWEYAAYYGRTLQQPVLDVGCGDGRWFQLVWPEIADVYGIDLEPAVVERAIQSGVYRKVWRADAAAIPADVSMFGTVFANCSLEHMDNIHTVMSNVWRVLRPGGLFIFSVVTDKINDWFSLSTLARALGEDALAQDLYAEWLRYHHLVNPFPIEHWCEGLIDAGFELTEHIPIIPEMTGRLFLLIDGLWHTKQGTGELGDQLYPYLQKVPHFPAAFRRILQGALLMESCPQIGCGAVLVARKVESSDHMIVHPDRICWCSNDQLTTFSADYLHCAVCGSLVSQARPSGNALTVHDDNNDFYGKSYWLSHQRDELGLPDIYERARIDLPQRCLYWLHTLLSYKLPPAKVLELGGSHGGFVALLRWAGFDAIGIELSPWVVDFAKRTFDVPMLLGDIEHQQLEQQSFDVVVLNDVLEHLSDPRATLWRCADLLKPDGIMLIQTPSYPDPQTYKDLVRNEDRFIEMLHADEHLYLFSQRALRQLFEQIGYGYLQFQPPLFDYDMYVVTSRQPLDTFGSHEIANSLTSTPSGRMVQALLDKAHEVERLQEQVSHTAKLMADVEHLKKQIADAELREAAQLERFKAQLTASEADRAARLAVIERQGAELGRIPALEAQLTASEADRAARLAVIERQGAEIGQLQQALGQAVQRLQSVRQLLKKPLSSIAHPFQTRAVLQEALTLSDWSVHADVQQLLPDGQPLHHSLEAYIAEIDDFNRSQHNKALLDEIRAYNHTMVEALAENRPLAGKRLLDIGASPHGYALEWALKLGVTEYIGVGLDVDQAVVVQAKSGHGKLLQMNAEQLDIPDGSIDLVISLSTFEHVGDVPRVLAEIKRVLRPGGSALISFEPIWTCSYGHHLHHFGSVAAHMPDWAHLLWNKEQMQAELKSTWPSDGAISLEEAVSWTFESSAINRIGISQMREYFERSGLAVEWIVTLPDVPRDPERLQSVAAATSISPDDLMVKGLSVLLNKSRPEK